MIKNDKQLARAQERCAQVRQTIKDLEEQYSGIRLKLMKRGFVEELVERQEEIREYNRLRHLDLAAAIEGPLSEKPMLLDNINEFLAKLRIAAGLTQEETADRLGWHQPNVSRFESDNYGGQTISKVIEYADSLGVCLHVVASLSGLSPQITYRRDQEQSVLRNEGKQFVDITAAIRRTDDNSASITPRHAGLSDEPDEPAAWMHGPQSTPELVVA